MMNVNNSNLAQNPSSPSTKLSSYEIEQSTNNTLKKTKKIETGTNSNNNLRVSEKSNNKSLSSSDIKGEFNKKKEIHKNNKLIRNKTVSLADSNRKIRVKFKKDFVTTIVVESYKKYNVDMSYNDTETGEKTKCRCVIF